MLPDLHLAAFALIRDNEGRILFKLRRDRPVWDLPGGKADPQDRCDNIWSPERTCIREVLEETGFQIGIDYTFGRFWTAALAHPIPSVTEVFTAWVMSGNLCINEEAAEFGWYSYRELPTNTFRIHADIVRQFENGRVDTVDLRHLVKERVPS